MLWCLGLANCARGDHSNCIRDSQLVGLHQKPEEWLPGTEQTSKVYTCLLVHTERLLLVVSHASMYKSFNVCETKGSRILLNCSACKRWETEKQIVFMKPTCQRTSGDLRQISILSSFAAGETWSLFILSLCSRTPCIGGLTSCAWASAVRMSS